jgi:hypothetical protein
MPARRWLLFSSVALKRSAATSALPVSSQLIEDSSTLSHLMFG